MSRVIVGYGIHLMHGRLGPLHHDIAAHLYVIGDECRSSQKLGRDARHIRHGQPHDDLFSMRRKDLLI
jgi:hypothetical protein